MAGVITVSCVPGPPKYIPKTKEPVLPILFGILGRPNKQRRALSAGLVESRLRGDQKLGVAIGLVQGGFGVGVKWAFTVGIAGGLGVGIRWA